MAGLIKHLIIAALSVFLPVRLAAGADGSVWQLRLQGGHPANCTLALTRVAKDDKGRPILEADSRRDKSEWHSCTTLPRGLLREGKEYVVALDYEIIERAVGADRGGW